MAGSINVLRAFRYFTIGKNETTLRRRWVLRSRGSAESRDGEDSEPRLLGDVPGQADAEVVVVEAGPYQKRLAVRT